MTRGDRIILRPADSADVPAGLSYCMRYTSNNFRYAGCGMGWAAAAVHRSINVRYYVTTAAGKIAVNCIQLCYNLQTATCAFFTNLKRWKFSYENRLVEISRESYDILAHERCPNLYPIPLRKSTIICTFDCKLVIGKSLVLEQLLHIQPNTVL